MSAVASGDRERLELARKTVPDELIMALVRESIASVDGKPIRLDGFPLTVAHAARVEVAAEQSAGSVRSSAPPRSVASAPAAGSGTRSPVAAPSCCMDPDYASNSLGSAIYLRDGAARPLELRLEHRAWFHGSRGGA